MYALAGMAAIAFVILDVAFITSDFSYNVVASGSSTTTPAFYRAAAIWATQQGSLLLWVMLLSCGRAWRCSSRAGASARSSRTPRRCCSGWRSSSPD